MWRRTALVAMLVGAMLGGGAQQAFAWCNGPYEGDGYGTHDWVLDHAIDWAGEDASWMDVDAALRTSDDPDTYKTNSNLHLFRDEGIGRGAPQEIADLYHDAVVAYQAGDYTKASQAIGVMSHYYADIAQPFHADYSALNENDRHFDYEYDVDKSHRSYSGGTHWLTWRERRAVTDVRATAVATAKYSCGKYPSLITALKKSSLGSNALANDTVDTITGQVLSRATNDLADVIATIPEASALAPTPTTVKSSMNKYYVGRNHKVCAYVKCYDADGDPMEGVGVNLSWPLPSGTKKVMIYTDKYGVAHYWQDIGSPTLLKKITVSASQSSSGETTAKPTWYLPTPALGSGTTGIKTSVNDSTPARGTVVKVTTRTRTSSGKAVPGLKVTFYWKHKSGTIKTYAYTDANGYARTSRNIGQCAKGYRVYVKGQTMSGSISRSSTTSFVPH